MMPTSGDAQICVLGLKMALYVTDGCLEIVGECAYFSYTISHTIYIFII